MTEKEIIDKIPLNFVAKTLSDGKDVMIRLAKDGSVNVYEIKPRKINKKAQSNGTE